VQIAEAEKFGLVPNNDILLPGTHNVYMVSFFHQLHCLRHIQMAFIKSNTNSSSFPPISQEDFKHIEHCFDWIRQGIMCSADTTLERVDIEHESKERAKIQGTRGHTHTCSNWSEIGQWMNQFSEVKSRSV